jgi:hypothetical protein
MTVERPKVLLPLVNVPMINYTLEWLLASGVDEVSLQLYLGAQYHICRCCDFRVVSISSAERSSSWQQGLPTAARCVHLRCHA